MKTDRAKTPEQNTAAMEELITEQQAVIENQRQYIESLKESFDAISNSHIWKATKPLRVVLDKVKSPLRKEKESATPKTSTAENKSPANIVEDKTSTAGNEFPVNNAGEESEPSIPKEWLDIQRRRPLISIVIAVKGQTEREVHLKKALESLCTQCYQNLEVVLVADAAERLLVRDIMSSFSDRLSIRSADLESDTQDRWSYWNEGVAVSNGSLIGFLEQEDTLTPNCLAYVIEAYNESVVKNWKLYLIPDAYQLSDGALFFEDFKADVGWLPGDIQGMLRFAVFEKKYYQSDRYAFEQWFLSLKREQIFISPWIGCYGEAVKDVWEDSKVRCIPFYLPQFHEIPENNKWWGEGFTEWDNVKKAEPLYKGHHQPRIPGELGYYDLEGEEGAKIQKKQIALAKEYGLAGFCYYYYWFDNGKRLLEMPLDRHLHDQTMDFPFCLCWANENWTRKWDGQEDEILMSQTYQPGWAKQFILDILPYMKDERYIRVNGAPFLLIYNLWDIPNPGEAIHTWRTVARQNGIEDLHISAARRTTDAKELQQSGYTLDSLTDFPPHVLEDKNLEENSRFGQVRKHVMDYRKACAFHADMPKQSYTYFRTAMLEWDNTSRRGEDGTVFEEFSIEEYKKWLYAIKRYELRHNRPGEDLVFINAWNEWAEGTYLEPSEPLGHAALEATKEVLERR